MGETDQILEHSKEWWQEILEQNRKYYVTNEAGQIYSKN